MKHRFYSICHKKCFRSFNSVQNTSYETMNLKSEDIELEPSRYECCAMLRNLKRYANVYAQMMKTSMWPAVQQASLLSSCSPSPIHWMEKMRTFCEARSRKSKINNFSSLLWLLLFCCWCQISAARGIFMLSITKNFNFFSSNIIILYLLTPYQCRSFGYLPLLVDIPHLFRVNVGYPKE